MESPVLLILAACVALGVLVYIVLSVVFRRAARAIPAGMARAGRVGEVLLLIGSAILGATLVNAIVRSYLARSASTLELLQGLLFGVGLSLVGIAGLYGATMPGAERSVLARAYAGSRACRLSLAAGSGCMLAFFILPQALGLLALLRGT